MHISVVLPAFNEAEGIQAIYDRLKDVFDTQLMDCAYDFIFVNDGSTDDTAERIKLLGHADEQVKLISLSRNFGHQSALSAGMAFASGDAVITMDCDLEHPPGLIPEMIEQWLAGHEIVYARRREQMTTLFKKVTSRIFYRLIQHTSEVDMPRDVGDFRLVDQVIKDHLVCFGEQNQYLRGQVAWLGFKHTIIEYDQPNRTTGAPRYTLVKMMRLAMDGLLSFSMFPLRLGLWLGLFTILLAAGLFVYIAYQHFIAGVFYQLYKWLMVIMLGFMGLLFIFLWVVGEYVGRIYNNVRQRPLYVVQEKFNL